MIIGITGSFGSGKTTVADLFAKHGFRVINVDKLYHNIYKKNNELKNKIKKEFGTLDRNKIKNIVFNDSKKLKKLNEITHPIIIKEIKKEIIRKSNNRICSMIDKNCTGDIKIALDIPLLFEAKATNLVDKIIVVKCNKNEQINRILKKKKYTKKEINNIINSQMPLKEKIKKADFVVDNGKAIKEVGKQVKNIVKAIHINI
tara:strand:+ start:2001 stop:2606 length:606 start_codon:yes stop_codon:yes gene_type:complete